MKISKYFSLEEFTRSDTARRLGIDNTPTPEHIKNLSDMCVNLLDPLRSITGVEWIAGKRYKVRGFWVADAKTMCFDLNEGVQEDFRSVPQDDRTE